MNDDGRHNHTDGGDYVDADDYDNDEDDSDDDDYLNADDYDNDEDDNDDNDQDNCSDESDDDDGDRDDRCHASSWDHSVHFLKRLHYATSLMIG